MNLFLMGPFFRSHFLERSIFLLVGDPFFSQKENIAVTVIVLKSCDYLPPGKFSADAHDTKYFFGGAAVILLPYWIWLRKSY